jgi:4-amino-4-deoxy-L-arabinose transferase-like glycosyltransferase
MQQSSSWISDLGRLVGIWAIGLGVGGAWVLLDRNVPAWDQAEHLSLAMNHWWILHHSPWFTPEGLRQVWMITPKYPPVFYWATAAVHSLVGPGADQALLVNGVFGLVLLIATYALGRHLFSPPIGLLAAGITLLFPRLVKTALDFQLDYAVTAMVLLAFWCLTVWRDAKGLQQWLWIIAFGLSYGLALMTKQSALLFFVVPIVVISLSNLWQRRWLRLLQLMLGAGTTLAVMLPWLSVNWIFQFSILGNTNVKSAQDEGDPMLNTLAAWTYYWQDLPTAVSWVLLLVPLVGLVFWYFGWLPGRRSSLQLDGTPSGRFWLLMFVGGGYLLWSAIVNKDPRYIAPLLPAVAVVLAWGLECWWRKWPGVTYGTIALAITTTLLSLFPWEVAPVSEIVNILSPQGRLLPQQSIAYPHAELVSHIAQTQPYQIATVGGLQSTAIVNQHNVSYFGKLQDYQVYGRQVGSRPQTHELDTRSLSWFYAQGDNTQPWPPTATDPQALMAQKIHSHPDFVLDRTWALPNDRTLYLYRRQQFPVTVTALPEGTCPAEVPRLSRVEVPAQVPPGQPMPVTYEWVGSWRSLHTGRVLLNWNPTTTPVGESLWIHDHGIGLGTLRPLPIQANLATLGSADINPDGCFQITERTATRPPAAEIAGTYQLTGTYFTESTPTPQPLTVPAVTVTLNALTPALPSPALDGVTQLREAATALPQGTEALDQVFNPLGHLNQYDPIQNYLVQAEETLQQRWQTDPLRLDYGYGLVLAQVMQMKAEAAIASLTQLAQQDSQNPYSHAYLGFVNLYLFRPQAAQVALAPALELAPDSPEIRGLSAIAMLLRGNLWGAWQEGQQAIALTKN